MRYFLATFVLLLLNFIYSAYSINVAREYAKKVADLKREREKGLVLKADMESYVNYRTVKIYAESFGFSPIDWSRVKVVKSSTRE